MLFSISEYNGRVRFGDSAYYFKKQLFATALGLMTMYMVSEIDYQIFFGWHRLLISFYGTFSHSSFVCRTGNQWLKKVAESWTVIFSAFGICKAAVIFFWSGRSGNKKTTAGFWFMCRTMLTLASNCRSGRLQ